MGIFSQIKREITPIINPFGLPLVPHNGNPPPSPVSHETPFTTPKPIQPHLPPTPKQPTPIPQLPVPTPNLPLPPPEPKGEKKAQSIKKSKAHATTIHKTDWCLPIPDSFKVEDLQHQTELPSLFC